MSSEGYTPPTIRGIVLGISLAIVLLILLCRLGDMVKIAGVVLLWLPNQLGLVEQVRPEQVQTFELAQTDNVWQVAQPGRYAVYTGNDKLLEMSIALGNSGKTWLNVHAAGGSAVPVIPVQRGLGITDSPFVPGRPVYRMEVPAAGAYSLVHPHPPGQFAIVPDTVTGREVDIFLVLAAQFLIVGGIIGWLYYRRRQARQKRLAHWRPKSLGN